MLKSNQEKQAWELMIHAWPREVGQLSHLNPVKKRSLNTAVSSWLLLWSSSVVCVRHWWAEKALLGPGDPLSSGPTVGVAYFNVTRLFVHLSLCPSHPFVFSGFLLDPIMSSASTVLCIMSASQLDRQVQLNSDLCLDFTEVPSRLAADLAILFRQRLGFILYNLLCAF